METGAKYFCHNFRGVDFFLKKKEKKITGFFLLWKELARYCALNIHTHYINLYRKKKKHSHNFEAFILNAYNTGQRTMYPSQDTDIQTHTHAHMRTHARTYKYIRIHIVCIG